MSPLILLVYSFLFGLLHGILPDEHTWPITFSYAIGGASGKEGLKAGLFFSASFTVQRMMLSELAYLALAPFLLSPTINGVVYVIVGIAMGVAGAIVIFQGRYRHIHLPDFLTHRREIIRKEGARDSAEQPDEKSIGEQAAPPAMWTIIHGFLAGFGFGGFSLFINTIAAPSMPGPLLGFLPGMLFGLGTMIVLAVIGILFGTSLRWARSLTKQEIKQVGARTGGRTLLFGGVLFTVFGVATLIGLDTLLPVDAGYVLITVFMVAVAVPAFIYSWREVMALRK